MNLSGIVGLLLLLMILLAVYSIVVTIILISERKKRMDIESRLSDVYLGEEDRLSSKVENIRRRLGRVNKRPSLKVKIDEERR